MTPRENEQAIQRLEVVLSGVVTGSAAQGPELDMGAFNEQLGGVEADLLAQGMSMSTVRDCIVEAVRRVASRQGVADVA